MTEQELQQLKEKYPEYTGKKAWNTIDLTNQQFGNLLVLYRTLNREDLPKNQRAQWVCQCQCEKKTICIKSGLNLRQGHTTGCGCTKGNRTEEVPSGTKFGDWEVIERVPNQGDNRVYYKCKCLRCNKTIKNVMYKHLKSGASTCCPECGRIKSGESTAINEQGKTYGFLYVERRATEEEKPRHDRTGAYWNCTCTKCGRKNVIVFGDYLRKGDTKSCGCLTSLNESKIAQMLDTLNIKYIQQQRFEDLTSTGRSCDQLMFDFGIYNNNTLIYLIEFDGIQHFDKTHEWKEYGFETTHNNDLIKNKYCFNNNIPLIRIPYDAEYDLNDLKLETTRFLLTSENEKEYYDSRK